MSRAQHIKYRKILPSMWKRALFQSQLEWHPHLPFFQMRFIRKHIIVIPCFMTASYLCGVRWSAGSQLRSHGAASPCKCHRVMLPLYLSINLCASPECTCFIQDQEDRKATKRFILSPVWHSWRYQKIPRQFHACEFTPQHFIKQLKTWENPPKSVDNQ